MRQDPLSISYARALLEIAADRVDPDTVFAEVEYLIGLLAEDRDFRTFVLTPGIDASAKRKSLDTIFGGRLTDTVVDFLQVVVVQKGRAVLLEDILEAYRVLYDEKMDRIHVDAVTAVPLAADRQTELSDTLSRKLQKTILLDNPVKPEIVGGLIIRFGDMVVDGSIRTRIKTLSARIAARRPGSELIHED